MACFLYYLFILMQFYFIVPRECGCHYILLKFVETLAGTRPCWGKLRFVTSAPHSGPYTAGMAGPHGRRTNGNEDSNTRGRLTSPLLLEHLTPVTRKTTPLSPTEHLQPKATLPPLTDTANLPVTQKKTERQTK